MARLLETPEAFIFELGDNEEISARRSMFDEGVDVFTTSQFAMVSRVELRKPLFDFQKAREFLETNFFVIVSDEQREMLSKETGYQIQFESDEKFYAPEIGFAKIVSAEVKLETHDGKEKELLLVKAVPLTEGTHKKFTFPKQVLHDAVNKWLEATIVIGHEWGSPGNSVGSVLFSEIVDDLNEITFLLTKQHAIDGVKNGHFHSVSSNVFVKASDDLLVSEIMSVDETSLTPTPADEDSVVKSFDSMILPLTVNSEMKLSDTTGSHPVFKITRVEHSKSPAHTETKSPPIKGVSKNKEKIEMEKENTPEEPPTPTEPETSPDSVKLENRLAALELENTKLKEQQIEMAKWQKVLMAEKIVDGWISENKILPAQSEKAKELLVKYSKEVRDDLTELIELQQFDAMGSAGVDVGFTDSEAVPYENMSESQIKLLYQAEIDDVGDHYVPEKEFSKEFQ